MSDAVAPADRRTRSYRRASLFALVVVCTALMGEKCEPTGILANQTLTANPSTCTMLPSPFPLALAFGSDTLWVADASRVLVPFAVEETPPQMPTTLSAFTIPEDSDGNGTNDEDEDSRLLPVVDDIIASGRSDLLLPTFGKEAILFFSTSGILVSSNVAVPDEFTETDDPELPAPGGNRSQTGFSTKTCIEPPADALDAEGRPLIDDCRLGPAFYSRTTSGVAVDSVLDLALVTFENSTAIVPQPGVVAVYDFGAATSPHQIGSSGEITTIFTSGFRPSDIVIHTTTDVGGIPRRFALVAVSGTTAPVVTPAAIDVIDIETLERVASYPLGTGGISPAGIQIDAAGTVAVVGSPIDRQIYAVDLGVLETEVIPTTIPAGGSPLDLSVGVIFDRTTPLEIVAFGAPILGCPGAILGLGFNHAGTRLFATDNCDGSFAAIEYSPTATGASRFGGQRATDFAAPRDAASSRPRGAGRLVVRPEPLTNFSGPDVFVLVDEPEGMVCGLFVDAVSP